MIALIGTLFSDPYPFLLNIPLSRPPFRFAEQCSSSYPSPNAYRDHFLDHGLIVTRGMTIPILSEGLETSTFRWLSHPRICLPFPF